MHLFIENIPPERVEHGFDNLLAPREYGVLKDTPMPRIPSLKQLPILSRSELQQHDVRTKEELRNIFLHTDIPYLGSR